MPDAAHQLFRTYGERMWIVRWCCIHVTY
jgi:hypothetical protein